MRAGAVSIQDVIAEGFRLTGGFHISEDRLAIATLRRWRGQSSRVGELVTGRGLFRGPIFSRIFVDDPSLGEPYVSARDIVNREVSPAGYLSRKHGSLLADLRLHEGMILVTCSGMNLGKAIWTRRDLDGLVASHDLIRIEPNPKAIPPGYLHAFLASRYGNALIRKQIYGGNIKHVEPEHIANLLVPRLGRAAESRVDELVRDSAQLRSEASAELSDVQKRTLEVLGLPDLGEESVSRYSVNAIEASKLNSRLDAPYHCAAAAHAVEAVAAARATVAPLSTVVKRYFKPPMFKRIWVDGPEYGRYFISGVDAYRLHVESSRYVSFKTPRFEEFLLEEGTVIFQAAGQIYGLFGQPVFVSGWLSGVFAADDLYRLVPHTKNDGGFLYAFFRTAVGQVLLKRQACGNSIPRVWDPHMRDISIPWPELKVRDAIGKRVAAAHEKIERARVAEIDAIALLERVIEKGATN